MPPGVIVVGAGPAGTAAAITLARAGVEVTVIDKARFPRDKCCGDGLTTGALRLLEDLGLDPTGVDGWYECSGAVLRSPSGRQFTVPLPRGRGQYAAIVPRWNLDAALVGLARDAGAEVREGVTFTSLDANDGDGVAITVVQPDGTPTALRGTHLVAADGMWSPIRRALGTGTSGYLGEWHAFRQYVSGVSGSAASDLHVWFERDLLPGYAWSFPLPGNRANFGFGVLRGHGTSVRHMKEIWSDLPRRPHIAAALGNGAAFEGRHTAWPIPARVTSSTHSVGRVLFVGDAVCATDSLTGEGIGQALLTGILAARAITTAAANPRPNASASAGHFYHRMLRQEFAADHRMSRLLGRILASPFGARGALRLVDTTDFARRNFARWMFEDEPRAIVLTPRRWHRGFLDRPGAFASSTGRALP